MTTSPNVLIYSAIDGWRRQMVRDGRQLLGAAIDLADRVRHDIEQRPGLHVLHDELLHAQASHDLDRLHVLIDVAELSISGYQAADGVRAHRAVDLGLSDHRRVEVTLTTADDDDRVERLLRALDGMVAAAAGFPGPPKIDLPSLHDIEIDLVLLPRDAFLRTTRRCTRRGGSRPGCGRADHSISAWHSGCRARRTDHGGYRRQLAQRADRRHGAARFGRPEPDDDPRHGVRLMDPNDRFKSPMGGLP